MGAFVAIVLASFCSVGCFVFAVMTFGNPHNDLTRAYTGIAMVLLGMFALGLWLLVGVFEGRSGDPTAEGDWNPTSWP